jgi:cation diffusion facilitator family transporter
VKKMGAHCCEHDTPPQPDPKYRRILWVALVINAAMFVVELYFSFAAGSVSLLADSVDFLGDAANYGISLWVLTMSLHARARASLFKAACMTLFGIWVIGHAIWNAVTGVIPDPEVMGTIGMLALIANLFVAWLLYAYRNGDSNMRSVWLCTRNDALGNIAVIFAAIGVFGTGTAWPDLVVATIMAVLALTAAWQVMKHARKELAE